MNQTVPKAELLERERRWSRPAGIAALLGAACFVASTVIQQSAGGSSADSTAELLEDYHEHGSALLAGNVVASLGLILFSIPLWFLFNAAAGRSNLVRRAFIVFAFIGPFLLAVQGVVSSAALNDISDKFVSQAPQVERQARAEFLVDQRKERLGAEQKPGGEAGAETTATTTETTTSETTTDSTATESTGTETSDDEPATADEKVEDAREDLADDLVSDSGAQKFAVALLFPGALGMVVGMVYIPLWGMRTGLLTRFWATLGMALGVSLILLGPLGQLLLVLWFAAIGLMLLGLWPGGRPPSWEAGEAIPWPKPGDPAADEDAGPGAPIEGSGREVSEQPLPERAEGLPPGESDRGESQGQRRKKRKRRG